MKFGLSVTNFGDYFNPNTVASLASEAEKKGWDGFFLWDHISWMDSPIPMNDPGLFIHGGRAHEPNKHLVVAEGGPTGGLLTLEKLCFAILDEFAQI